jgi:TFIIF-interacting CTD phosphatase-like protein
MRKEKPTTPKLAKLAKPSSPRGKKGSRGFKGPNGKINVFLDLDQTLISGEPTDEFDFEKYEEKSKLFKFYKMGDEEADYYLIFERPGLQEFLDFLFKNFNVSVWTAASKDYAIFIIDKILLKGKPERKLDYIFFSYHCDWSKKKRNGTKDLSFLWKTCSIPGYNPENTIIIDDLDEVSKTQPDKCIRAPPFYFKKKGSEQDTFLSGLIPILQEYL